MFQREPFPEEIPREIPEEVQKAAISMVNLGILHPAILAGREIQQGNVASVQPQQAAAANVIARQPSADSNEKLQQLALLQPGPIIAVSIVYKMGKFRANGGKAVVIAVFNTLSSKSLGRVVKGKSGVSTSHIKFIKLKCKN